MLDVLETGTSVGGTCSSASNAAAAAAALAAWPVVALLSTGSVHSMPIPAKPRASASRRVQYSSATIAHLPDLAAGTVTHGIERPEFVLIAAARQRLGERP